MELIGSSFECVSKRDFWIRHQNQVGVITPIKNKDGVGRGDATFEVVPGLSGRCHSLGAIGINHGFFFRHQDFRIVLAKFENSDQFRKDATFCMVAGLSGLDDTISFQATNINNFFIRHFNFQLFLNKFEDSPTFREDASFIRRPNLQDHDPQPTIDDGSNDNPI